MLVLPDGTRRRVNQLLSKGRIALIRIIVELGLVVVSVDVNLSLRHSLTREAVRCKDGERVSGSNHRNELGSIHQMHQQGTAGRKPIVAVLEKVALVLKMVYGEVKASDVGERAARECHWTQCVIVPKLALRMSPARLNNHRLGLVESNRRITPLGERADVASCTTSHIEDFTRCFFGLRSTDECIDFKVVLLFAIDEFVVEADVERIVDIFATPDIEH